MRKFLLMGAALVMLSGCVSISSGETAATDVSAKARQALAVICSAEPTAYGVFAVFAPGRVSATVYTRVGQAHAAVTAICANPPTDVASAFQAAAAAYAAVLSATTDVERIAAISGPPRAARIIIQTQ